MEDSLELMLPDCQEGEERRACCCCCPSWISLSRSSNSPISLGVSNLARKLIPGRQKRKAVLFSALMLSVGSRSARVCREHRDEGAGGTLRADEGEEEVRTAGATRPKRTAVHHTQLTGRSGRSTVRQGEQGCDRRDWVRQRGRPPTPRLGAPTLAQIIGAGSIMPKSLKRQDNGGWHCVLGPPSSKDRVLTLVELLSFLSKESRAASSDGAWHELPRINISPATRNRHAFLACALTPPRQSPRHPCRCAMTRATIMHSYP